MDLAARASIKACSAVCVTATRCAARPVRCVLHLHYRAGWAIPGRFLRGSLKPTAWLKKFGRLFVLSESTPAMVMPLGRARSPERPCAEDVQWEMPRGRR